MVTTPTPDVDNGLHGRPRSELIPRAERRGFPPGWPATENGTAERRRYGFHHSVRAGARTHRVMRHAMAVVERNPRNRSPVPPPDDNHPNQTHCFSWPLPLPSRHSCVMPGASSDGGGA
jgi:hypothetical protein